MLVIGIVGGVASGKTLVANLFRRFSAEVLDADRAAHEVLLDNEVEQAARQRWGEKVFGPDGHIDRAALAKIVFGPSPDGPQQLAYLNGMIHPRVERRFRERISELAEAGSARAVVIDAPVIFEAGWGTFCDAIVFVEVPRPIRLSRALLRGWTEEEFSAREAAQASLEKKRDRADVVVDNSGSEARTRAQIETFWQSLG